MSFVDRDAVSLDALHKDMDCCSDLRLCAKSFAVDGDICRSPLVGVRASSPAALVISSNGYLGKISFRLRLAKGKDYLLKIYYYYGFKPAS
jgi:hypothetical protein